MSPRAEIAKQARRAGCAANADGLIAETRPQETELAVETEQRNPQTLVPPPKFPSHRDNPIGFRTNQRNFPATPPKTPERNSRIKPKRQRIPRNSAERKNAPRTPPHNVAPRRNPAVSSSSATGPSLRAAPPASQSRLALAAAATS